MKLIKAYIRTNMIDKVIHALEARGFTDVTLIDVKARMKIAGFMFQIKWRILEVRVSFFYGYPSFRLYKSPRFFC